MGLTIVVAGAPILLLLGWMGVNLVDPFSTTGQIFSLILSLSLFAAIGTHVYRRQSFGEVLLDLGPHPGRWIWWMVSLLSAVSAILSFNHSGELLFGPTVMSLSVSAYFLMLTLTRFEVRDRGLTAPGVILPWHRFSGFTPVGRGSLRLCPAESRFLSRTVHLHVPQSQAEDLERIVSCNLPKLDGDSLR